MRRAFVAAVAALPALLGRVDPPVPPPAPAPTAAPTPVPVRAAPARHLGVSFVAGGPVTAADFEPLVAHGVNCIVQTPFGWQRRFDSPEIGLVTSGRVLWGETDEGLKLTTELARQRGIVAMLKPHVWLTDQSGGQSDDKWRGEIRMASEADWQKWFASYRRFILHYARFAETHGIEALCVGTELGTTVRERPDDWRRVIAEVRGVYRGKLTYGANWYQEFEAVEFWDDLDYIGIHAYFPLVEGGPVTVESLQRGWRPHLEAIDRVRRRFDKPVIFTELGYRSMANAAERPWEWPRGDEPVDLDVQAACYEAFFRTFWERSWFAGVYWWKWFPHHDRAGGPSHPGFTPQRKLAAAVMRKWYRGGEGAMDQRNKGTEGGMGFPS